MRQDWRRGTPSCSWVRGHLSRSDGGRPLVNKALEILPVEELQLGGHFAWMLALARVAPQPSRVCAAPRFGVPHHRRRTCPRALVRAARMAPYAPHTDAPLSAPVARRGHCGYLHERVHAQPQGSQRPLADSLEARQPDRSSWQTLVRACMRPLCFWHLPNCAHTPETPLPPFRWCRLRWGIESSGGGWTR